MKIMGPFCLFPLSLCLEEVGPAEYTGACALKQWHHLENLGDFSAEGSSGQSPWGQFREKRQTERLKTLAIWNLESKEIRVLLALPSEQSQWVKGKIWLVTLDLVAWILARDQLGLCLSFLPRAMKGHLHITVGFWSLVTFRSVHGLGESTRNYANSRQDASRVLKRQWGRQ